MTCSWRGLKWVRRRCILANDAELLATVLGHRADQITATTRAALDTRDVIKRAQNNGC